MKKTPLSPFEEALARRMKQAPLPDIPPAQADTAARNAAAWLAPAPRLWGIWDRSLWRAALASLSAGAAPFWLLCAFLLGAGVAAGRLLSPSGGGPGVEPLAVLVPLAPVPFLCFLIRELQIRDPALAQLERSCLHSAGQVCLVRLWTGCFANGALLAILSAALGGAFWRLCLGAFAALFLLGAAALLLLPAASSALPLSVLLAAWVLGGFWLLAQQEFLHLLLRAAPPLWAGIAAGGLGLFVPASLRAAKKLYA